MALVELLMLVAFTIILFKSSELVVDNANKLAIFFGVSKLAIGMVLIATSTSIPELSVSVISSAEGNGSIAAGNVFGSNIANMLLVLGTGAFFFGFRINRKNLKDISLVLFLTTIISIYIVFHSTLYGGIALGSIEGFFLLVIAFWYFWTILKKDSKKKPEESTTITKEQALHSFLLFFAGIIMVLSSSSIVVKSSVSIAKMLGVAESFIGATLIAVGTSLPELSIDIQAIRKKQYGLAIGDAIGSNMANITLVLGAAAAIHTISITLSVFIAALLFAVIANSIFLYFAISRKSIQRTEGFIMLVAYVVYIVVIFGLQANEILIQ